MVLLDLFDTSQLYCTVVMENIFNHPYYRVTKWSLQCIGHWPFQSQKQKRFLRCLTFSMVISILIPQMIKLIESLNEFDILIECLQFVGAYAIALTKCINWIIMEDNMRRLLLTIKRDWEDLKLKGDIEVLHEYSERGRRLNIFYATSLFMALLFYICSPVIPKVLDFIKPLNGTRQRIYLYQTEYFIDQDKYYVHLLIHAYLTVPIGLSYITVFDHLLTTLISHACGMFEILKRHLETVHMIDAVQDPKNTLKNFEMTLNEIKRCSNLHTRTLKLVEELESSYNIALLIVVGINVILIGMVGLVALVKISDLTEMIRVLFFGASALAHLFWISWLGHALVVQSECVFLSAYQSEWYRLPYQLQRMIIPIMMRSLKPCKLTAGKFYVMSMESFGAALRTIMSVFTVFNSMR